jgi:hypothetical protein
MVYNQGGEFFGFQFQQMLDRHHIHKHPITAKNPQANAVCERMHHQVVGNSLRVLSAMNPPAGITHANQLVDTEITNAMYANSCNNTQCAQNYTWRYGIWMRHAARYSTYCGFTMNPNKTTTVDQ